MTMTGGKTHLAEALHWSREGAVDGREMLGAGLGMAVPVLLGAAAGEVAAGLAASVGALMVAAAGAGKSGRAQARALAVAFMTAAAATGAAALAAGQGWQSDVAVALLAGTAAAIGGLSRPLAAVTTRFILLLIIAIAVAETTPERAGLVPLILSGALWAALADLLVGALAPRRRAPPEQTVRQATARRKLARWRRSLAGLAGWQYALRLTLCLVLAGALRAAWPDHHLIWIALTVALLTERWIEPFPVRTTQRALGTAMGVLATGLLTGLTPPGWVLVVTVGGLAALRPLLRARNYLAYSAVVTPLIVLILDAGRPLEAQVLLDRLIATLIGAALVIGANLVFTRLAPPGQ